MKRHFGTNDGFVPWCEAYFGMGRLRDYGCVQTYDTILEPDYYCEKCIDVYNRLNESSRGAWHKKPLKGIDYKCNRRYCYGKANESIR